MISACQSSSTSARDDGSAAAVDVDVSITYTDAENGCGHLGYPDLRYFLSEDRSRAAVDLDQDGSTEAFRSADGTYFRASAFELDAPTRWVVVSASSSPLVRRVASTSTLGLWSYGLLEDEPYDPYLDGGESGPIDTEVPTDAGVVQLQVRDSEGSEPINVPTVGSRDVTPIEDLRAIDVMNTRPDLRPECSEVVFGMFDTSRRACAENVLRDLTVGEWARANPDGLIGC